MTPSSENLYVGYCFDTERIVTSKCIYKIKHVVDGSVEKYKAIFVARGFSQVEGIYYEEKFSPLHLYTSIRMIIYLATSMGWRLHHMDVKTTFSMVILRKNFTSSS
jgi:hypothetical protein